MPTAASRSAFEAELTEMRNDWNGLKKGEANFQKHLSPAAKRTWLKIRPGLRKMESGWDILKDALSDDEISQLTSKLFNIIAQPWGYHNRRYHPHDFYSLLGLQKDYNLLSPEERVEWDNRLQRIFLLVDAEEELLELHKQMLLEPDPLHNRNLFVTIQVSFQEA